MLVFSFGEVCFLSTPAILGFAFQSGKKSHLFKAAMSSLYSRIMTYNVSQVYATWKLTNKCKKNHNSLKRKDVLLLHS